MAATPVPESADGPVLSLINKRLRALRKKHNRILQMEESVAQGKALNNEQREVLRSKPSVSAAIDELEKLRQPLSVAVSEEIEVAIQRHRTESQPSLDVAAAAADVAAEAAAEEEKSGETEGKEEEEGSLPEAFDSMVGDLLNLLYFGALFDVKSQNDFMATMLSRAHERGCCLNYDYVTDDATDLLSERDLDMISALSGLLVSRPVDSSLSHKNALQRCIEHAKLWLANAHCPVDNNADISYAGLRERLNKIMASDFFTTSPEMKASAEVAAAAAAGNYGHFQAPIAASVQVDSHPVEYQPQHGDSANSQGQDFSDDQSNPSEEFQKDEPEFQNPEEIVSGEQEEMKASPELEHNNQQDTESREQQYGNRRNYQHQRGGVRGGGGRRGYTNGRGGRGSGRGGGGYQNGRSNQYYDQPGNYYPRNYQNNRGGRGGSRGGSNAGHPYNSNHGAGSADNMGAAS